MGKELRKWTLTGPNALILTARDVAVLLGLSGVRRLYEMIERGQFPRGRLLTPRKMVWSGLDLACYLHLAGRFVVGQVEVDEAEKN